MTSHRPFGGCAVTVDVDIGCRAHRQIYRTTK